MSYPHANVERGLPTQAGSAQKKHNIFSDVLPESVFFLFGHGSENQQKSS